MFTINPIRHKRKFSSIVLVAILIQLFLPLQTFALTGGPSQAEYESFEPAGASEMVNLATGDFVYNIPLLDVDGYPINISYHAGVSMEQEASWVGLGWNLNVGAINRAMRGLPDDFDGDRVVDEINIKENKTYGINLGLGFETLGLDVAVFGVNAGFGINYNNYKGLGLEVEVGVTGNLNATFMGNGAALSGGLGLKLSNQDGADFTMNANLGGSIALGFGGAKGKGITKAWNSRQGMVGDIVSGSQARGVSIGGVGYMSGTGTAINLIPNTAYTPSTEYGTKFSGITGEIHIGGEIFWCNGFGYTRGYYFKQELDNKVFARPAYGYLNLEHAGQDAMMDFNRDKDGTYYTECPKLPFANLTYDIFNTNAQGLNEVFRPYRNDFGAVHDIMITGGGSARDVGVELNIGNILGIGANDYGITTNNISGYWSNGNNTSGNNQFHGVNELTNPGTETYEHVYFKALDELTVESSAFYNSIGKNNLASFSLVAAGNSSTLDNTLNTTGGGTYGGQTKTTRDVRNSNFSFLNVEEAQKVSITNNSLANKNDIIDYPTNNFIYTASGDIDANSTSNFFLPRNLGLGINNKHISEATVLKEDGSRYIYGIPVYNTSFREEIFNVNTNNITNDDLVSYTNGSDNTINNSKGMDNFFNRKSLPPYAHSYLLTALQSSDYVDITGDGMTNDDYGDYTKFNYSRTTAAADTNFLWRNPVSAGGTEAIFEPGLRADPLDDKGAVVSGSKQLWYVHSIETKNYVAEFHISNRDDGRGVNAAGNIMTTPENIQKKLEKIVLYSKFDLTTPIKTVNFTYDYILCPGTPNSIGTNQAKLTLTKIDFTYGKSDKGVFNPYQFIYADGNHDGSIDAPLNPSYDRRWMDRWGCYQTATANFTSNNKDFPYTTQDKPTADNNAAVWSLSSIITPAKSKINVSYESDSYSSIQDKTPGQMITMVDFLQNKPSFTQNITIPITNVNLYNTSSPYQPKNWMIVDLTKLEGGGFVASSSQPNADVEFRNVVLPGTNLNDKDQLFFRGFVKVGNVNSAQDEMIPGYAEFDRSNSGLLSDSSTPVQNGTLYKYAYIKLKDVDIDDENNSPGDNCNPITKAGWQITKTLLPKIAYPGSEPGNNALTALTGLWGAMTEVFTFKQKNKRLRKKGFSALIYPNNSIVRVNVPNKTKYGGGHRVSKIEVVDNWNSMVSSEATTTYGQTYDYTIKEFSGKIYSSGVASYEPLVGGEENSLREPIDYSVVHVAAPDDAHFVERPIGESFYPPSTIIYGKVTVKNLDRLDQTLNQITSNIGRTEYEFYTAKDFPIYSDMDGLQSDIYQPDPEGDLFNTSIESSVYLSQGFILKLNNMHGKLKSILTFQQSNINPISGTRYFYKTSAANQNELDNKITVINENGVISYNQLIGQNVEVVSDLRSSSSVSFGQTKSANLNISGIPFTPIIIPIPFLYLGTSSETRDFYSATLNKVVTQNGILTKIENINDYSTSTTENLVWDAKTHDVVLSKTSTNYKDFDYAYSTPAYWVNEGMGAAFKNLGYGFKNVVNTTTGQITLGNGLLKDGDEIELIYTDVNDGFISIRPERFWIRKVTPTGTALELIDRLGKVCKTAGPNNNNVFTILPAPASAVNYILKVIRSGYRNLLTESAEIISFASDPKPNNATSINKNLYVLDAGATEFSEDWLNSCSYSIISCNTPGFSSTNPYILNTKGNWREKRGYSYLSERLEKNASNVYDIRKDGTFATYKPFYEYSGGSWKTVYDPTRFGYNSNIPFEKWVLSGEITKVNQYGNVLEAKDALNVFSSSLYGYNQTLKKTSVVNARYREIANHNFEDHFLPGHCQDNHWIPYGYNSISNVTAHTGRYSCLLPQNGGNISFEFPLTPLDCEVPYGANNVFLNASSTATTSNIFGYSDATCKNCVSTFGPISNWPKEQKYTISVWFKESQLNSNGNYSAPSVNLSALNLTSVNLLGKSGIINGWQKFDYELVIPPLYPTNMGVNIDFVNTSLTNSLYVDDIRIHPSNASMASYVYDPKSLRLWSDLDDRNFATFYEYSNEGVLVRVKKETEKGILTIQETRNSFKKN